MATLVFSYQSKKTLSRCHDTILVYTKERTDSFELNRLPRSAEANDRYKNPDNDPRGIWKAGGGFKFYELAPSVLKTDKFGNLVINKEYNADMLAAAMAKHEGFTYAPDSAVYWKQGKGAEKDISSPRRSFSPLRHWSSCTSRWAWMNRC